MHCIAIHAHRDACTDRHTDVDGDRHMHTNYDAHGDRDSYTHAHRNADSHCYTHPHGDVGAVARRGDLVAKPGGARAHDHAAGIHQSSQPRVGKVGGAVVALLG